jgi:DNA-binding response OmpR family regulator
MTTPPIAWVLEDSATLALQLARLLKVLGYQVMVGEPAGVPLPLTPPPTLICVELLSSDSNGFKLLRQLAAHHQCPRLLFTATGRNSDQPWGLLAGATAVLQRPCTLALLSPWAP